MDPGCRATADRRPGHCDHVILHISPSCNPSCASVIRGPASAVYTAPPYGSPQLGVLPRLVSVVSVPLVNLQGPAVVSSPWWPAWPPVVHSARPVFTRLWYSHQWSRLVAPSHPLHGSKTLHVLGASPSKTSRSHQRRAVC